MLTRTNVKINLGLSVLRKRDDGFHDIETLFVPCFQFGDNLEIISGDDFSKTSAGLFAKYSEDMLAQGVSEDGKVMITIAREEGVDWDPLSDLCVKAYSLLAKDFNLPPVKIFLEKQAPVGAGLGGGSADAAFALKMLNQMFELNLSDTVLSEYAARLGSDCAFFIFNKPMFGSGRGEILEPCDVKLDGMTTHVLVPEGISVSTAEAYRGIVPQEKRSDAEKSLRLKDALAHPAEEWKDLLVNDFETSVFALHPELASLKQSLYDSGALYASMSGSGSAVFALYK